ncbi:MAG: acetylxylan esterase [Planctomycetes bacterium]|nr:acetylxylan esterase [Planctomycetota bacterium]
MLGQQVIDLYHTIVDSSLRRTPFDGSSKKAFLAWQRRARRMVNRILGEMPRRKIPLDVQKETVEETQSFVRERLVYFTRPGLQATAYLLTPRRVRGRRPGVLCLHGHSRGGKDEVIDPHSIYHGFGRRFAEEGCVVLCPDQIGFGERALPEDKVNYGVLVHGLNMLGHTLIGLRYWDLVRALDLMEALPTVRRDRLGVMGLSLGGEMTLFLSALEVRVHTACVCGYLTSHRSTFLDRPHCTCGHLRDLARHFEHVDLAALIAPRPLFLDAGREDSSFPFQDAQAIVRSLRPVYELFGRPASTIGIEIHEGAHEIAGRRSIPWMLRQLSK